MSKNQKTARPRQGGSYVRQPSGALKRTEFTKPSNGPEIGEQLEVPAPEAAEPEHVSAPASASTKQEK
ncbi:hypothetical protein FHS52_001122 [Erythromicrobium ramosum]|uniref:Uncharacterized protein n=1 Tax=Erythrobacter ramosus TaxID=35811 RepID=A0A6I4UH52_9SPHN|nr:hypothetical protein [Erythrobacter ramosus]MBB3775179.1 hypothetical protein [Erythrobacter ramosus]MXP37194.1 hypothetical protein [Erythrobacter ramosus]